jgi:hypothetical protein
MRQWCLKCGPRTGATHITWELVTNANPKPTESESLVMKARDLF